MNEQNQILNNENREECEKNTTKIIAVTIPLKTDHTKYVSHDTEKTPPNKRVVTQMKKWNLTKNSVSSHENQWNDLLQIQYFINQTNDQTIIDGEETENCNKQTCSQNLQTLYLQEIKRKIYSYKSQDMEKKIYNSAMFVDLKHVINLLVECKMNCFYCKETVKIIYEIVREPKQWSLDRIDNKHGHNIDNVVIACLCCNLRRRTMYHERYVFTKQMNVVKKT